MRDTSAEEAVQLIVSGNRVYVHEASMAPISLIHALTSRGEELENVEIVHLHTHAPAPYVRPEYAGHLRHNALFVGDNVREAVQAGRADFTPVFLSEIPAMIRDGPLRLDVALLQVSPPDRHGFCRLGLSTVCARAAVDHAKLVLAEINPRVPLTSGNTAVHVSQIDVAVGVDRTLPVVTPREIRAVDREIARHVASLIPNGATLQMGIGAIPDAVLSELHGHEGLGVHTEMFSDGLVHLFESGVVSNRNKTRFEGRAVTSFAMGTKRLHDFVDGNPAVEFHASDVVNDPNEIGKQHQMVAINSAIQIDLTGQVCADSIGSRIYSGIGGQMDFFQRAVRSPGGRPILALPATAKAGTVSRIVPELEPGAGVVTTRGHVQWVVTENGAVNLHVKSLRERARILAEIAAPQFRPSLLRHAQRRYG
ncbi:MAG: acetyl-CoA hydrolase/transferase C-terminal domain-containing protein [Nannocystaceae bacterium]